MPNQQKHNESLTVSQTQPTSKGGNAIPRGIRRNTNECFEPRAKREAPCLQQRFRTPSWSVATQ